MIAKTWNIRDQTKEDLTKLLEKKYKEIENDYKLLKKNQRDRNRKKNDR